MKTNPKKKSCQILLVFIMIFASLTNNYGSKTSNNDKCKKIKKIAQKMKEAYDNGNLKGVIRLYREDCFEKNTKETNIKPGKEEKGFKTCPKEMRAKIYHWVVHSYYALDKTGKAEPYLKKLQLLRRKGKKVQYDYWLPIKNEIEKYAVVPRLLFGFHVGFNSTKAHPLTRYPIIKPAYAMETDVYGKEYTAADSLGTKIGFMGEYALTKKLSVVLQPSGILMKYRYKNSLKFDRPGESEPITVEFIHQQTLYYWELPILLKYRKYQYSKLELQPFLQAGVYFRIPDPFNKSKNEVKLYENEEFKDETGTDINELFNKFNGGYCVGAGIHWVTGFRDLRVEIEIIYKHGFNNIVNGNHRYDYKYNKLIFGYYDVFDDMKLSNWDFSIKLLVPVYFKLFRRKK